MADDKVDPEFMAAHMITQCNRLNDIPGAGDLQGVLMLACSGFAIAAAIRDMAAAVRGESARLVDPAAAENPQ